MISGKGLDTLLVNEVVFDVCNNNMIRLWSPVHVKSASKQNQASGTSLEVCAKPYDPCHFS